jgi:hypothetical protein
MNCWVCKDAVEKGDLKVRGRVVCPNCYADEVFDQSGLG